MRLGFFLKEAIRSIRISALPSFAAVATILVTMLVLGVFIPLVKTVDDTASKVQQRIVASVFLKEGATQDDIARVKSLLQQRVPNVKDLKYISPSEGAKKLSAQEREGLKVLGKNVLPAAFEITPKDPTKLDQIKDAIAPRNAAGKREPIDNSIDKDRSGEFLSVSERDTDKVNALAKIANIAMAFLVSLLSIASIILISNTIRISLFARRREIEVMKLVGATNWFIRWPFVIEGILIGAFGGLIAIALLSLMNITIIDFLEKKGFSLIADIASVNFGMMASVLLLASIAISAIGSGLSLRRFLKV